MGKQKTVSAGFRASLASLVEKLNTAEPHFVRCVKPNADKVPEKFTSKMVMEQLTFSGVLEAIKIRQQGYSTRLLFDEFLGAYKCVVSKAAQKRIFGVGDKGRAGAVADSKPPAERAAELAAELVPQLAILSKGVKVQDFVIGKTKVLMRAPTHHLLEKSRDMAITGYTIDVQRLVRGAVARKKMRLCRLVFAELTSWVEENPFGH